MENGDAPKPNLAGAVDIEKNLLIKQLTDMQMALLTWQAVALLALVELDDPISLTKSDVERIIAGEIEVKVDEGKDEDTEEDSLIYSARLKPEENEAEENVEVEVDTFDSEPDSE